MLALMQGNLGAISGLNTKLKAVLTRIMGGTDTPQKRKEIVEQEAAKLKALLEVPAEIQRNIHEGFDPIIVSEEVIDNHFARIFNFILDFDSSSNDDA